jgi:hypothetical protein
MVGGPLLGCTVLFLTLLWESRWITREGLFGLLILTVWITDVVICGWLTILNSHVMLNYVRITGQVTKGLVGMIE